MQGLAELRQNRHLPLRSALDIMYLNDNLSKVLQLVKNSPVNAGDMGDTGLIPGSGRSPGGGRGNPLVFSPGGSHGQRSLVGYGSWGRRE